METPRSSEALEVRPDEGPEVRHSHDGLEALSSDRVPAGSVQHPYYAPNQPGDDIEKGYPQSKCPATTLSSMKKHRWRWIMAITVLLLIVAVIGGAVGGTQHNKKRTSK